MDANTFLKGWMTGARLRARNAVPAESAAGTSTGNSTYDKASFLSGLAAGMACRGAPMWVSSNYKVIADAEYLLPLGAGIPVSVGDVDVGSAEYLLPLGAGIPVEFGEATT